MAAIAMLLLYLACGCAIMRWQLPGKSPWLRGWLGCCAGLLLLMWLPALCAFTLRFSQRAHGYAIYGLALITLVAYLARDKRGAARWDARDGAMLRIWLCVALPLIILGAVLQYTHVLRPENGNLNVGQATYGDLNLHLGIATSLRDAAFPPDYSILPGAKLSYPFLADSLSTSLMLFGLNLRWAVVIPGTLMMALVFTGYLLLARAVLGDRPRVAALAALLLFFNGGLGFLYDFDLAGRDPSRIAEIFIGFYKTPANQPDLNLRWSNIVADLLLPQRTLLGGWMLLLPALYLLHTALREARPRLFLLTALFAGALPLLHTHSFLALGLCSGGWALCALAQKQDKARRRCLAWGLGLYFCLTMAMALPQLVSYAFSQTMAGGVLRWQFNWANNSGGRGMIDGYLWFWLKNVGPAFLLLLCALLDADSRRRALAAGGFSIYLVAELVLFQRNEYDNNKLFYVWYMVAALLVADYAQVLWHRLRGLRGRYVLAAAFALCAFASGGLSIAREVVSDYRLFSADAVACAAYVDAETPKDAVFMTGQQHINPVAALAGRHIVCGTDLYLYFHGLQYAQNQADCRRFYQDPANNLDVLDAYDVDYILLSDYERADFQVFREQFDALFTPVFEQGDYILYRAGTRMLGAP
ncbi:MAG: hypothetical protein LBU67_05050 [Oscillospiraceae bacterium]|jgi:hypothetical protein|nr:hypothetical protein [Oscillospiraceae bacterium]